MSADKPPLMPEGLRRLLAAAENCPAVKLVPEGNGRYRVVWPVPPPPRPVGT
jgi:hypothetical protein